MVDSNSCGAGPRALGMLTSATIVLVPSLMLLAPAGGTELFVLAALVGIGCMIANRGRDWAEFSREERLATFGCAAFTATVLYSVAEQGFEYQAARELDVLLRPLLAIPVLFLLRRTRPPEGTLWLAMAAGAVLAGGYAIYDVLIAGHHDKAQAVTGGSHILFGRTTLAMGFIAAIGVPYFRRLGPGFVALAIGALGLGLLGSFLSGSRGAWAALPVLVALLLWQNWRPGFRRLAVSGAAALVLLSTVVVAIPATGVLDRLQQATHETRSYFDDRSKYGGTSVGLRFEMWRGAFDAFAEHPLSGIGMGARFNEYLSRGAEDGQYHPSTRLVSMPHNAYLQVLVSRGIIGFAGLLALWGTVGYVFWTAVAQEPSPGSRSLGFAGLALLALYLVGGLTHSVMDYGRPLTFFCLYSMVLVHLIARRGKQESVPVT